MKTMERWTFEKYDDDDDDDDHGIHSGIVYVREGADEKWMTLLVVWNCFTSTIKAVMEVFVRKGIDYQIRNELQSF